MYSPDPAVSVAALWRLLQLLNKLPRAIYGGVAGIELPTDEFDLGHGVILRRTYCYLFGPLMAAFTPPKNPGDPSPAPWEPVNTGISYRILAELYLPEGFDISEWFSFTNSIWWFVALLRLKANPHACIPLFSQFPFKDVATVTAADKLHPVEIDPRRSVGISGQGPSVSLESLEWVRDNWEAGAKLMRESETFNTAFQAYDSSAYDRAIKVAMITLWGALEQLFSPSHSELTFRVSANIATYLEPRGDSRYELFKRVTKLYNERSKAAHGSELKGSDDFIATHDILRRILIKMIESRHVPSRTELDSALFML